jgi:hypothetical protein
MRARPAEARAEAGGILQHFQSSWTRAEGVLMGLSQWLLAHSTGQPAPIGLGPRRFR